MPTEDDIFPPMPEGTELVPATRPSDEYTLDEIRDALKDHIRLDLSRFDNEKLEWRDRDRVSDPMKLRLLHVSPPVLGIDNFFSLEECSDVQGVAMPPSNAEEGGADRYSGSAAATGNVAEETIDSSLRPVMVDSKTFSLAVSKRTSTSWFCHFSTVPTLVAKALHCLGIPVEQMEEPQVVKYQTGQEFR